MSGKDKKATALHWAIYGQKERTVKELLKLGADPNLYGTIQTWSGNALQFAEKAENRAIITMLNGKISQEKNDPPLCNQESIDQSKDLFSATEKILSELESLRSREKELNRAKELQNRV